MASTKAVEEPKRAVTHIQNTAPAPPAEMAATTPTRFPMPTRVAVAMIRVWKPEMEFFWEEVRFSTAVFSISGKRRTGRKRVRAVKKIPAGISRSTRSDRPREPPPGSGIVTRSPHRRL